MHQLLAVRDDEERAEARRTLGFLQAIRQSVPASLDDSSAVKDAYEKFEQHLIEKSNGTPPTKTHRRFTASKSNTKKPARRAPQPAK